MSRGTNSNSHETLPKLISRHDAVASLRIHARVSQTAHPPGTPAIVLVHGLSISSRYEIPLARRLARLFNVFAPDLPGFGQSDDPPAIPLIIELGEWLDHWLDIVALDRVVLIGNSLGAHVAVDLAMRKPERITHLVLSGLSLDPHGRNVWTQIGRILLDVPREPLSLFPLHARDFLVAGPGRVLATLRDAIRDPLDAKLPCISMPALVIRGEHDPLAPQAWSEELVRHLPNGRLAVVAGAPHAVNYSRPDAFAELVSGFIQS